MIVGTLAVLVTLAQLRRGARSPPARRARPRTRRPSQYSDGGACRGRPQLRSVFPLFLAAFLFVFAATGIGNGSTYRMIPAIWKGHYAARTGEDGSDRADPRRAQRRQGGLGRDRHRRRGRRARRLPDPDHLRCPLGRPTRWRRSKSAFVVFPAFYVVCLAVTWLVYLRPGSAHGEGPGLTP